MSVPDADREFAVAHHAETMAARTVRSLEKRAGNATTREGRNEAQLVIQREIIRLDLIGEGGDPDDLVTHARRVERQARRLQAAARLPDALSRLDEARERLWSARAAASGSPVEEEGKR